MRETHGFRIEFEQIEEVALGLEYPVFEGKLGWYGPTVYPYEGKA